MKPRRLGTRISILALITSLLASPHLWSQRPAQKSQTKPAKATVSAVADPKLKGVWEPVSYPADLILNDVFFVTPEIGWVTGGKYADQGGGVLLHTADGGATWSSQLGDAESAEAPFRHLYFLDERHGWVLQGAGIGKYKLLRTSDAENWEQFGSIEATWGLLDYAFTTPTNGVYLDGNNNVARIMHTSDGGRTWREASQCKVKLPIEGLMRDLTCTFKALHFPTADVGYAVGGANGAKRTLFVGKTEDGGQTWKVSAVSDIGGDLEVNFDQEVYFTDERTGLVHLSDNKLYRTTDGGRTWTGVIATPGPELKFADAEVGWTLPHSSSYNQTLSFTTDGGRRWTSRPSPFPAAVLAFSLPRRDRAYVVGEHGMIYRYRVLSPDEAVTAKALAAPAMPGFDSPLDNQVDELAQVVDALEQGVAAAPDSAPPGGTAASIASAPDEVAAPREEALEQEVGPTADVAVEGDEPAEADAAEMEEDPSESTDAATPGAAAESGFAAGCCAKPLGRFELVLTAITGTLPQFLSHYKNANLLLAGLRMITDLPGRVKELNGTLLAFQKAPNKAAALAALAQVTTAVENLKRSTAVAFQRQPPPATDPSGTTAGPPADATAESTGSDVESGSGEVESSTADEKVAGEAEPADTDDAEKPSAAPTAAAADDSASEDGGAAAEAARAAEQQAKQKAKESVGKAIKKKFRF